MKLNCFLFAACNDTKRLSDAVLSRFQVIHLKEYTKEEFVKVTVGQLDVDEGFAIFIAENV